MQKWTVGDRVRLNADFDYTPYTVAKAGERGEVIYASATEVEVKLDRYHPGLTQYQNAVCLFDDDMSMLKRISAKCKMQPWVRAACVSAVVLSGILGGPEVLRAYRGPAHYTIARTLLTPVVTANDEYLEFEKTMLVKRVCTWELHKSYMHRDTRRVVARLDRPGTALAVSSEPVTYRVRVELPKGLAPGVYIYSVTGRAECDHGDVLTEQWEDIQFEVVGEAKAP